MGIPKESQYQSLAYAWYTPAQAKVYSMYLQELPSMFVVDPKDLDPK